MLLVCPCCGGQASAEAWANDAAVRDTVAAIARLPKPVQEALFPYLALFRPAERALTWPRARKIVGELAALVGAAAVGWEKSPDRPATPALWARGMTEMAARKGGFKAHFTNHNYLRKIVYDLADQADAAAERRRNEAAAKGGARGQPRGAAPAEGAPSLAPAGLPHPGADGCAAKEEFFAKLKQIGRPMP